MKTVQQIDGIEPLVDRYDGFILDLWGTIHNGFNPLPGALDAMALLRDQKKEMLILSNAPRRAESVVERLDRIGIPRELYSLVLSSGEAGYRALRDRDDAFHSGLGERCFLLGPPDDDSAIAGLPLERATSLSRADFIVAVGSFARGDSVSDYEAFLAEARGEGLPMVCVNPDLVVIHGDRKEICAGAIAARYAALGGTVFYHGKPHRPIYDLSLEMLGVEPDRILAVGDSLHTDVDGANGAGIDCLFITSGIYADRLRTEPFRAPEQAALDNLCIAENSWPLAAAPAFRP